MDEISQELLNYDVDNEFSNKVKAMMLNKHYDFLFTVNYFPLLSNLCQEMGVLYISWSCDNPLISMHHNSVFNSVNRIFVFDMTCYREFKSLGVENIFYMPLAVDTNRLDFCIANYPGQKTFSDDISFVGSLYEKNSYDRIRDTLPDYLKGYFEAIMEGQRDIYGVNIIDKMLTSDILEQLQHYFKLDKSEDSFSDLGLIFSTTTLGFKIAQLQRYHNLIELSKRHNVSLYTNSDTSDLIRVINKGSVDYWSEMPVVFRNSKINLNMTIPNIKSGIPLRCFDVMGSGGFLLTNFQAEIPLFFEDGKDLVCYHSQEDLLEKVEYYLEHDEEREAIARSGYEKVRRDHNYVDRIDELLEVALY